MRYILRLWRVSGIDRLEENNLEKRAVVSEGTSLKGKPFFDCSMKSQWDR